MRFTKKKEQEDVIEEFMCAMAPLPDVTAATTGQTQAQTTQATVAQNQNFVQKLKSFAKNVQDKIADRILSIKQHTQKYVQSALQFARMVKMIALFFPLIIVARMIIGFFQKPLEFIMLGIACIFLAVFYVIYFIFSIPPFTWVPFLLWFIVMDIIPLVVYTIVMGALFLAITIFCILVAGLNILLGGALKNLVLCQNPAAGWYKTPNFHLSNKYERGFLCSRQCFHGYYPDDTGMYCVKVPKGQPSFCPQAEVMRMYTGQRNDWNFHFKDYQTTGNLSFLRKSPEQREVMIKNHYLRKRDFLEKCEKSMNKYKYMPLSICSSLDIMEKNNINGIDKKTISKLKTVCSQAFCDSKSNYPFCASLTSVNDTDAGEFWKNVMKIFIMISTFVFIVMFTLGYMAGVTVV